MMAAKPPPPFLSVLPFANAKTCSVAGQTYRIQFSYQVTQISTSGGSSSGGGTSNNFVSVLVGTDELAKTSNNTPGGWTIEYDEFTCSSNALNNVLTITVKAGSGKTTVAQFDNFLALSKSGGW